MKTNLNLRSALLVVALSLLPSILFAGTESYDNKTAPAPQPWCETPPPTELRIGLPGWMSGLSGDFGVKGVVTDQDVKFLDLLKRIDMIAVGSIFYRYHRWEFFADGQYIRLSDTAELRDIFFDQAHVALKTAFAEGFVGYRLVNCQKATLSLFAGARYNYMSGDINIERNPDPRFPLIVARLGIPANLNVYGEKGWVDPVVGASGRVHLWKPVSLWAKGDIGGFGAASDLAWQLQGGVEIQVTRSMWSAIGWRYMKNDYTSGGFTNKTALSGPYLETGFNF
ncbi:MAG TPA: hypothetical protein VLQ90_12730 [Pyrinomonadaceae bacterium]|nr:hypothetical protein [Pyrinomonadaceae bacterium]